MSKTEGAATSRQKESRMTTLQECLQEVIDLGSGYFIRSDAPGAYRPSQWEPAALLADMQHESPGVLRDPAWTQWDTLRDGSTACSIQYGVYGSSISHREVPGYGHLHALELSHKRPESFSDQHKSFDRLLGY